MSSVVTRTSIPVLHAAAAMLKIAEMPYTGANSIFLRVMLDKKYALPYRVTDALVFHFYRYVRWQPYSILQARTAPILHNARQPVWIPGAIYCSTLARKVTC